MVTHSRGSVRSYFLASLFIFGFSSVHAQSLPPGEGLEIISLVCTQCHGIDYIVGANGKFTREGWENALYDMIARGAPVEEKDREVLLKYLQDNLARK